LRVAGCGLRVASYSNQVDGEQPAANPQPVTRNS
jgi:hypothetical protein